MLGIKQKTDIIAAEIKQRKIDLIALTETRKKASDLSETLSTYSRKYSCHSFTLLNNNTLSSVINKGMMVLVCKYKYTKFIYNIIFIVFILYKLNKIMRLF